MIKSISFPKNSLLPALVSGAILTLLFSFGCKDIDEFIPDERDPGDESGFVITSSGGIIENTSGESLSGALVRFGTTLGTTDDNGVFLIPEIEVPDFYAPLLAKYDGYFKCYRTFRAAENELHAFDLDLRPLTYSDFYSHAETADITDFTNFDFSVAPNSLQIFGGGSFSNPFRLAAQWITNLNNQSSASIPVSFLGKDADGKLVRLEPKGLFLMELYGEDGSRLDLTTDASATVQWQRPNTLSGTQVPLWRIDPETGLWMAAGSATINGDIIEAELDRNTYWAVGNYRAIQDFSTSLQNNMEEPIANMRWEIRESLSGDLISSSFTGSSGLITSWLPSDEPVELRVYNDCNDQVLFQDIGAISENLVLPPLILDVVDSAPIHLKGDIVDCLNQPISMAYLKIDHPESEVILFSQANGKIDTWVSDCGADVLLVTPADLTTQEVGDQNALQIESTIDFGSLPVCDLVEFVAFNFDGENYQGTAPSAFVDGGYTFIQESSLDLLLVFPDTLAGTSPIDLELSSFPGYDVSNISTSDLSTNITTFGQVGDFILGTFGGVFEDSLGVEHTISGSYKVIREE